jgi:hypothetical protein
LIALPLLVVFGMSAHLLRCRTSARSAAGQPKAPSNGAAARGSDGQWRITALAAGAMATCFRPAPDPRRSVIVSLPDPRMVDRVLARPAVGMTFG